MRRKDPDCALSHCCAPAAGSGTAERDGLAAARTQALEAALESLQGQLGQLETALSAKGADAAAHKAAAAAASQRAEAAEARVRDLEGEAEQLGSQVASMQVTLPDGSSRDLVPPLLATWHHCTHWGHETFDSIKSPVERGEPCLSF